MTKIDEQIKQCEADIESLQKNLKQLKEQKKKEETYIFKEGDVVINGSGHIRFIYEKDNIGLASISNKGYEIAVFGQQNFEYYGYKKIATLQELVDFWRGHHD